VCPSQPKISYLYVQKVVPSVGARNMGGISVRPLLFMLEAHAI
jgi:hypothetical protein